MVEKIYAQDWEQIFYQDAYPVNGIFGLGRDVASNYSKSFLAHAVAAGIIDKNQYSFTMSPNDTGVSELVLGSYNANYSDETTWIDMALSSNGWQGDVT